jgi:hypothetical protein
MKNDLHVEELAKKIAEGNYDSLKKKLDEKKSQINAIKNPDGLKNELPKSFLASEKLAFTKKFKTPSPVKKRNGSKQSRSPVKKPKIHLKK